MPTKTFSSFIGGLVTLDQQSQKDDQLTELTNFFYNSNKRPQTRRGYKKFGNPVPDTVVAINELNAITDITASLDATTLATGTAIKGTNSVSFAIDVSNDAGNQALVTWAGASTVDISGTKGSARFYIYVPDAFNTDLTAVKYRLGSGSSNYYEWTLDTLTEASNNFIVLDYADATTTGTPVDTAIDYFLLDITYAVGYTDKAGILIDWMYSYSDTSTSPVTSWMFHRRDDTQARTALVVCGVNMYEYDETTTDWVVIDTGLTEFETKVGFTTQRTRWDYDVYKNVFYMCDGVNIYRSYDGTTITEYGSQPKFRYLKMETNRMFGAGDDDNPSSLYYTADAPANAGTVNANVVVVGGDQIGKINGLHSLGNIILCGKDRKIYSIDIATPSAQPIDARAGWFSDRSIANVGNSLVYFTDSGLETLKQRTGVTGSQALESESLTADLKGLMEDITELQYNANVGLYIKPLNNYYFAYDSNNDNIPDSMIVMSSLVPGAFSKYTLPALYDMGEYITSSEVSQSVFTSANGGQVYQFETGFDDDGLAIPYSIKTKDWDFEIPFTEKDYYFYDIAGLCSVGQEVDLSVIIDSEIGAGATLSDTFIDETSTALTIGSVPIGVYPIGGGASSSEEGLEVYPYKIRIPIGFTRGYSSQLLMESTEALPIQFTLDRVAITFEQNAVDVFEYNLIA